MTNRVQATGPESGELAALLKRADEWEADWSIYKASRLTLRLVKDLRDRLRAGEPVAWLRNEDDGYAAMMHPKVLLGKTVPMKHLYEGATWTPLYAAPPEQGWREDALRYRFLRGGMDPDAADDTWSVTRWLDNNTQELLDGAQLDAAIDAAMKSPQGDTKERTK